MGNLVVKDNALIEASHKLSEVEQRLVLLAIVKAREFCDSVADLRNKELTLHASDYIEIFGVDRDTGYKSLKKAVMGLYRAEWGYKYINNKGHVVLAYERFTQSAKYIENEATVKFMFSNAIIPMLVELEKRFTSYEIKQVSQLSSSYAMRLYEFFMQHLDKKAGKGWLDISLDDLRFRLGLLPTEYDRMDNFKRKILDYSINEINKNTDLTATYEQRKQGRTITGFKFTFKKTKPPKEKQKDLKNSLRDESIQYLFTGYTDKQLGRAVHSKLFIADYGDMVTASNPANQSSKAWMAHMVEWIKKEPERFKKRPMQVYLDDEQADRF